MLLLLSIEAVIAKCIIDYAHITIYMIRPTNSLNVTTFWGDPYDPKISFIYFDKGKFDCTLFSRKMPKIPYFSCLWEFGCIKLPKKSIWYDLLRLHFYIFY